MDQHVDQPESLAAQDEALDRDGLAVLDADPGLASTGGVELLEAGLLDVVRWAPPTQEPSLDPELVAILCGDADPNTPRSSASDLQSMDDPTNESAANGGDAADEAPTGSGAESGSDSNPDSDGPLDSAARSEDACAGADGGTEPEPASEREPERESEPESAAVGDARATVDPAELVRPTAALLFASPEALGARRLADLLDVPPACAIAALDLLKERLASSGLPLVVREVAGGWRLFTDPQMAEIVQRLDSSRRTERISPAGLETLSIIAYRQPVTKAEIEAIRGVQAGPMLRTLVDRGLVKVTGRADQPGSPLLYGTTADFLDRFGLASLDELPRDGELARD